ncbi:YcxB family protein [Streptacidiphilus cavernicola]|uniref:YcxB family protein n=1 Tax=Streptacidiphilus cavernicola TaxID=3342716 RepID=A0ABV6VSE2_9ACTN
MNIALSYQLTPDEVRRALATMARGRRAVLLSACAVVLLSGVLLLVDGAYANGALCSFLGVAYLFLLVLGPRTAVRRQAARLCQATQLVFTDAGFEIDTPFERAQITWAAISMVRETDEAFLLHRTKRMANIVPKRAFAPAQLAEFSAFAGVSGGGRKGTP